MEYRTRVSVGPLSTDDDRALAVLRKLEEDVPQFGPVLSWEDGEAVYTLGSDSWDARMAGERAYDAVNRAASLAQCRSLRANGLRVLEVERVPVGELS